jgi:peptidoglycan/xylan/chitin deacetylase (PgdA/CDA1 family)
MVVRVLLVLGAALTALAAPVGAHAHTDRPQLRLVAQVTPSAASTVSVAGQHECAAGLVALTFDDGPAPGLTRELVRILTDHHVPATFFMIGSKVTTSPGLARMVAHAGFTIGNHTWSHPELTRLSDRAIRREVLRTARELRHDGVPASTLMRPPYGAIDARVRADIRDLGLVPVLWNVDSNDWRGGSARQIADSILGQLVRHRDNIVLQHDGVRNSPASVAAVPRVIREARRRGYCFGRLGPHGHVLPPPAAPAATRTASTPTVLEPGRAVVDTPFGVVLARVDTA